MQEFNDLDTYYAQDPTGLAASVLHCPACGRNHAIPFEAVRAGDHLLARVPDVIHEILDRGPEKVGVIYDRHIEEKLTALVLEPLAGMGLPLLKIPLGDKDHLLDADVRIGDRAAESLPEDIDLFISVGSGVISDLTKWIATRKNKPFILIGTAASMNAYTSITASMTEDNVKSSKWLNPANAVLLDSHLLATAPVEMTCSGIGDLLARNVCNADWKLSNLIRGTYFCPVPFRMMAAYQDAFMPRSADLGRNDPWAMTLLADAILVSGYSMTVLDGQTSPSSGSEHVLSHFFDYQHGIFDCPKNFHGTQVGVGTIIMLTAYEMLREIRPADLDLDDIERRRLSQPAVTLDHYRVFGEQGRKFDAIVAEKRVPDVDYRAYLTGILDRWDEIWDALDPYLLPSKTIREAMQAAGAVTTLAGVQRSVEEGVQALLYGAHYRPRYTVLDLFWELGLFPVMAPEILKRSGVDNH